jgi:hypothetical protein
MDESDYLEFRIQDQIDWYDRKSLSAQRWFKRLRAFELIAAAAIPFMSGYSSEYAYLTPAVGFLGVLVAVVAGLLGLNQFQERWVEYRTTCEALKREKYLYLAKVFPYDGERAFPALVQTVEGLIAKETSAWGQYMRTPSKPKTEAESVAAGSSPTPERASATAPGSTIERIEEALDMAKAAAIFLPGDVGSVAAQVAYRAEAGVDVYKKATEGGVGSAVTAATDELLGAGAQESPLRSIVTKSLASFAPVLGTASPPLALILALGTVGAKLGKDAYEKWKTRILQLPYSSATAIPLDVIDANTGFSLIQQSPIFADAFESAMADRKFLKDAAIEFTQQQDVDNLWLKYQRRGQFNSRQDFEEGLAEFRRTAADAHLQTIVDPEWLSEAGGYQQVLSDVDALRDDPAARADLDELVTTVEKLQGENQPVLDMLADVRKEKSP